MNRSTNRETKAIVLFCGVFTIYILSARFNITIDLLFFTIINVFLDLIENLFY